MRVYVVLLVCLIGCSVLQGQELKRLKASTFHVTGSLSWPDVGPVNNLLQNPDSCQGGACYGPFRNNMFSFGFGVENIQNRFVWQADAYLYAISNPGGRFDAFKLNILQYYYGTFRLGYVVAGKPDPVYPFVLYPYVGGGFGFGQLRLSNNGLDRFARFNASNYIADVGIALNTYNQLPSDNPFFKFGGSIGYYFAPENLWSIEGTTADGPLPISPQGFYVKLNMGIGKVR